MSLFQVLFRGISCFNNFHLDSRSASSASKTISNFNIFSSFSISGTTWGIICFNNFCDDQPPVHQRLQRKSTLNKQRKVIPACETPTIVSFSFDKKTTYRWIWRTEWQQDFWNLLNVRFVKKPFIVLIDKKYMYEDIGINLSWGGCHQEVIFAKVFVTETR